MAVRAIRGAVQVDVDDPQAIQDAVTELVKEVLARNELTPDDLISIFFTTTHDLVSDFPAYAVRMAGITDVPMLCATEIPVPDSMPRVVRLMAHVETDRARGQIHHVYLRGAAALRTDLPR